MFESSWIIALLIVIVGTIGALAIRHVIIGAARDADEAPPLIGDGEPAGVSILSGLSRTSAALAAGLARVFLKDSSDAERYEALEEALIGADVGVRTTLDIVEGLRASGTGTGSEAELREALRGELLSRMDQDTALISRDEAPLVLLVVGVNGSGKTTTIGKLAHRYKQEGKKVLLAAGDTFRAGAIKQLQVWGERVGVPVVAHQEGADPAAVLFDGIRAGISRGMDVVICDTAGRLQAQSQLMDELGKVVRVMDKALPGCPHEVLLVLDATIGQNALSQARAFKDVVGATGIVLTKLDGTARGGVVVAVQSEMGLPVKLIGLGEGMEDLRTFEAVPFVDAMLAHSGSSFPS
jgi:fused signal recognition particle receptor